MCFSSNLLQEMTFHMSYICDFFDYYDLWFMNWINVSLQVCGFRKCLFTWVTFMIFLTIMNNINVFPQRMYKVKQFSSGSEPAGCLSKQQLSNQALFKAAMAKKNHLQDPFLLKKMSFHMSHIYDLFVSLWINGRSRSSKGPQNFRILLLVYHLGISQDKCFNGSECHQKSIWYIFWWHWIEYRAYL